MSVVEHCPVFIKFFNLNHHEPSVKINGIKVICEVGLVLHPAVVSHFCRAPALMGPIARASALNTVPVRVP